ncbi:MAG: hypothetical protein K9W44_17180 [Candidatus Lokiarchaeota archaeon]|nr:hypothetical protein [Candidatus Harpocratesius repetitus]
MLKLYKLWIFQRESGLNLVDATIDEFKKSELIDGNLISGLITSVMLFSKEILREDIRLIETDNFRLIFSLDEEIITVLLMDRAGPINLAEKILERLQKRFIRKYRDQIERSFRGDVTAFTEITQQIEEITQKRGIKLIHDMTKRQTMEQTEKIIQSIHEFIQKMKK